MSRYLTRVKYSNAAFAGMISTTPMSSGAFQFISSEALITTAAMITVFNKLGNPSQNFTSRRHLDPGVELFTFSI